jgi:hypothetical protein
MSHDAFIPGVFIAITTEYGQLTLDGPLHNLRLLLDALRIQTATGQETQRPTTQPTTPSTHAAEGANHAN